VSPALLLLLCVAVFVCCLRLLRWTVPFALVVTALVGGVIGTAGFPFRHLVEGAFGYLNLILALFAGAWFGQAARHAGLTEGFAHGLLRLCRSQPVAVLVVVGALLFAAGMATGVAGVAVLTIGVFVAPALARIGLQTHEAAAFIAVEATCGMIAPPVNVPAMMIADGVNMPFLNFDRTLLVLSVPVALFTVAWFARRARRPEAVVRPDVVAPWQIVYGLTPLVLVLGFWLVLRVFPAHIYDPGVPIVLVLGGLLALPALGWTGTRASADDTFAGVPLYLAAVLVGVGMMVQVMTLTGMRGWVVMQAMASEAPWLQMLVVSLPLIGGVLTSAGASNVLGVPFAFAFIHQDMIINVSALSSIAAIAEFMPPTAVGAALAGYVVGETNLWKTLRAAVWPVALLFTLSMLLLVFARPLAPLLTGT
jgi:GntP family gluconate:H+ symporter